MPWCRKTKIALNMKIHDKLLRKLDETPSVPQADPTPESVDYSAQQDPTTKLPSDMTGVMIQLECEKTTQLSDNDKEGDFEELKRRASSLFFSAYCTGRRFYRIFRHSSI